MNDPRQKAMLALAKKVPCPICAAPKGKRCVGRPIAAHGYHDARRSSARMAKVAHAIAQKTQRSAVKPKRKAGAMGAVMQRRSKPKARNPKRRAKEFVRCYHSAERVEFVKSLPCLVCGPRTCVPIENAHIVGDGMGRKAGYDTIVPLCKELHATLHRIGCATFERNHGVFLVEGAARTEYLWQQHAARIDA